MQWTVYGIYFWRQLVFFKIKFNFFTSILFFKSFFVWHQAIWNKTVNFFIKFLFILILYFNIHIFVPQAICNKTVAVESTPLSLTGGPLAKYDPKLGTTQSRKILKQKMTTMSSKKWWGRYCVYCPNVLMLGMGVGVWNFVNKKLERVLIFVWIDTWGFWMMKLCF